MPYDRPQTTMAGFAMCPACSAEYHDPRDRRFHAQPVACPVCGPQVWVETRVEGRWRRRAVGEDAIQHVRAALRQGAIVAIKGLGGFHLACDATNPAAVERLRRGKQRPAKPFAVMMFDLATVARHCLLSAAERETLRAREAPIVLLERRPDTAIAADVAPRQATLGVMLPYTPLHALLLEPAPDFPEALVMTSGNRRAEPLVIDNAAARQQLGDLVDLLLLHDRPIHVRCDDSVVRVLPGAGEDTDSSPRVYLLRRARGYAPDSVTLPWEGVPVLATGAEWKNTFCLTRGHYAFLSPHIGDLENHETLQLFERTLSHFETLFHVRPQALAHDLHPDYLATRYAKERAAREGLPTVAVQHHHAHIAACMAEHGLAPEETVIGVALDGTGFGTDGAVWGGEFLLAGYANFQRRCHLAYVPLPGGDRAVREPWRMALAHLHRAGVPWEDDLPPVRYARQTTGPLDRLAVLRNQIERGVNAPPTSSMGRLFDAASALIGLCPVATYEAQAAMELEACVAPEEDGRYPFELGDGVVDVAPMWPALVRDLRMGVSPGVLAARVHNTVAALVQAVCCQLWEETGVRSVVLSGGVWQNRTLLGRVEAMLQADGFDVYIHRRTPPNDGGLALGQAVVAQFRLRKEP